MNHLLKISIIFGLFSVFLLNVTGASRSVHDVETADSDSSVYTRLRSNVDSSSSDSAESDDEDNTTAPQSGWVIPRAQFDVGLPIYGTIFGFLTSFSQTDPISLFIQSIYIMSFLVCVQVYFGFYLSCHRREGWLCALLPEIRYNGIDFGAGGMNVSFGRWISGPFSWISEIISFLPEEGYEFLRKEAHFPDRAIVHLIFMVQLLYFFGLYDCYRSNIM